MLVFDKAVLEYLISYFHPENRIQLLPVTFNQQYRSFLVPKGSLVFEQLNPVLVTRINQASWQEVLRRYNLEQEK